MSSVQIKILAPFVCLHFIWVLCGVSWALAELVGPNPPKSIADLKQRANQVTRWYLNPFHDRSMLIWRILAWITGLTWLGVSFFE